MKCWLILLGIISITNGDQLEKGKCGMYISKFENF